MWNDFAEYIIKNYSQSHRIVEVGGGNFQYVSSRLKEHLKVDIVMTDIKPFHNQIVLDDVRKPNLKIYNDAGLIYSIRPPEELHPHLEKLCSITGADLIIKPFSTDSINTKKKMDLINYKKAVFYKLK